MAAFTVRALLQENIRTQATESQNLGPVPPAHFATFHFALCTLFSERTSNLRTAAFLIVSHYVNAVYCMQ
jgi:hypothetical protein